MMPGYFNLGRFNLLSGEISVRNNPIMFGGYAITDIVPYANILDVRIGSPAIETSTITPGISAGSLFARNRHKTRVIEVDIELPLDKESYPENVRAIRAWASSREPMQLVLSAYKGRYIMASCTNLNEFSVKTWWKPVTVKFECWQAYFVSSQPSAAQIGQNLKIYGDAEPLAVISYALGGSGRLVNPQWTFDQETFIKLSGTFTGGTFEIDINRQSVYHNGQSVMNKLTLDSRFPSILPGDHILTGPSGGIITWHERWL